MLSFFKGKRWNEGKRILPFSSDGDENEAYGSKLNDILIEAFGEVKSILKFKILCGNEKNVVIYHLSCA